MQQFNEYQSADVYQQEAARTDPFEYQDYLDQCLERLSNPKAMRLVLAALGLAGETGELVDHIKKWIFHGHPLDEGYLQKELGDIGWYRALAATAIETDLSYVNHLNIQKLRRRYPNGFSSEASLHRTE